MKVYIVTFSYEYEGDNIDKVFASKDDAEAYVNSFDADTYHNATIEIVIANVVPDSKL